MLVRGMDEVWLWGGQGGTRGSGIVSSAADVLWLCVVHGLRAVWWSIEMCMCSPGTILTSLC